MAIWQWIQNELLGMQWLNRLIGGGLAALGVDVSTRLGGSLQFFLYDVIKITVLLCVLIFVISYIQSYFPPERSRRILGRRHGLGANLAPPCWALSPLSAPALPSRCSLGSPEQGCPWG